MEYITSYLNACINSYDTYLSLVIFENQYKSIYTDCEELVKILVTRCKKINEEIDKK